MPCFKSAVVVLAALLTAAAAQAQLLDTTWTYQGRLSSGGSPVNTTSDFEFSLFSAASGGAQIGSTITLSNVPVTNGLFTVKVDFGDNAFTGDARWIEIAVRIPAGSGGAFTTLVPRQPVTAAPHALALPGFYTQAASTPNLLGGHVGNDVSPSVVGATISGGGTSLSTNHVTDNYGTVGGGTGNTAGDEAGSSNDRTYATVAGGLNNTASGFRSTVAGGASNTASGSNAFVGGGNGNVASGPNAVAPGGNSNTAAGNYSFAAGRRASANHDGAFVWSDSAFTEFASTANDQFLVNAAGGVGIGTNAPSAHLHVRNTDAAGDAVTIEIGNASNDTGAALNVATDGDGLGVLVSARETAVMAVASTGSGSGVIAEGRAFGVNASSPADGVGVYGESVTGTGVEGVTGSNLLIDPGVLGSGPAAGVRGLASNSSGVTYAVYGATPSPSGYAGFFAGRGHFAGNVGIGIAPPAYRLDVRHDLTNTNIMSIERTVPGDVNADLLQIRTAAGSSDNTQFIECEHGGDIKFRVWGNGDVTADGTYTSPADFAEMFRVTSGAETVEPGDVLVIDIDNPRAVVKSTSARSTLVAGVHSTKPGVLGSEHDWDEVAAQLGLDPGADDSEAAAVGAVELGRMIGEVPMAVVGVVPCKVSTENGSIRPGDLLVTSATPGHAMRDDNPRTGTVVGKALEPLDAGSGTIRILVTLH